MSLRIYQVDAFTQVPFSGNPAGVVPEASGMDARQMQFIAREMNLSETAFILPCQEDADFELRFFTPTEEVDLCGHATIASFHLLKSLGMIPETGIAGKGKLRQKTKAGILEIRLDDDGGVMMRQAEPVRVKVYGDEEARTIASLMGISPGSLGIGNLLDGPETWSTGLADILLPLDSIASLKGLAPDMGALAAFSKEEGVVGLHAFAFDDRGRLWCRNFAPGCGIPEEAATGTSNGALGACLHFHGHMEDGTTSFTAHQGDWMGRPSRIKVVVNGQGVWVGGYAVTVMDGSIRLP